ncbi:N2227-like protein-domain-containing protein [Cristinia sonorae]|uniref:N2227-like protein-domain-containing protein n=1 Tax=Cristinia sonorae TaxID=1940300 RepID=A0A8K0UTP0_9AGAR|nr:N2227-like protein-domain-containing protein [Cristinia sonorae]
MTEPSGLTLTQALAILIPLTILYLTYRILDLSPGLLTPSSLRAIIFGAPSPSPSSSIPAYFSLPRALASYNAYRTLALSDIRAMEKSYSRLTYKHKRVGYVLGYTRKLEEARRAEEVNAVVCRGVAGLCTDTSEFPATESGADGVFWRWGWRDEDLQPDVGRVREALKHFVRDWSMEGKEERRRIFEPILDVLREDPQAKEGLKVLVPGSGLGRLAWEISELGHDTTAIELSYFMTLAFRFLLSSKTTQATDQHTVHPYAYWFSHSRSSENTSRGIPFPDVVPRPKDNLRLIEGDFLKHSPDGAKYDYVVTLFFIDTSLNIISTLEHIHSLLKPGGTWINLGPLLWTGGARARLELSLEEVLRLSEMVGFRIAEEGARKRRTVECEYTGDRMAMMKWMYQAEFWVATKADE